jgi:alkanesulfonate monooxygenase SsuD/methylene tetrahydromethanopterin reductase-like flavin-dependent oxidoreductase (luciferase family)
VRDAAQEAGRDPDEIKYFVGLMTTVAPTVCEALDRRIAMAGDIIQARLPHLDAMIGLRLDPDQIDEFLTDQELAADHIWEWIGAGVADGFWLSPDVYEDGIDAFVDNVSPSDRTFGM